MKKIGYSSDKKKAADTSSDASMKNEIIVLMPQKLNERFVQKKMKPNGLKARSGKSGPRQKNKISTS